MKKVMLILSCILMTRPAFAEKSILNWKVYATDPIKELSFPVIVYKAKPQHQFQAGYQFSYENDNNGGYVSLSPTVNSKTGKRQFIALFVSLRSNTRPMHPNCTRGTVSRTKQGVTCKIIVSGNPGDTFIFNVTKKKNRVTGEIVNQTNSQKNLIGEWAVDALSGELQDKQSAWIKTYITANPPPCNARLWPYYEVKLLPPSANNGNYPGIVSGLDKGSDLCVGALRWKKDITGLLVKAGYK